MNKKAGIQKIHLTQALLSMRLKNNALSTYK